MTTAKIKKTERERTARAKIMESTNAGKKIKTRGRKTDHTIDTRMNEEIERRKRNDGIEIRRVGEENIARADRKGEIGGMRMTGEEITVRRDWNERVKGTSMAIENVDIVIAREKELRMKRMILGINRTSTKENDEEKRNDIEEISRIFLKYIYIYFIIVNNVKTS